MDESNLLTTGKFRKTKPQFCLAAIKTKFNEKDFMSTPSASTPFSSARKFNITDIRNQISGVSYLSKFYFRLLPTIGITSKSKIKGILEEEKMIDIFIYANNVTVPQRAIDGENYTYSNGYRVNFPTTTSYGDGTIGINVRMDESYKFYDMFIQWMDIIHNKKTGHLSFYDDYVCDIEIFQLSYSNMNAFVSGGGSKTERTGRGRRTSESTIATYIQFQSIIEDLANTNAGGLNSKRTSGRTNNYSRFIIRNCYPKTISSIEFSHESQEKVNCLVNFAYEGIDYDVSPKLEKTQESVVAPSGRTSPTGPSSPENQVIQSEPVQTGSSGQTTNPVSPGEEDVSNNEENKEAAKTRLIATRNLGFIAETTYDLHKSGLLADIISTLPPDSLEAKIFGNPENLQAVINASTIRNATLHAHIATMRADTENTIRWDSPGQVPDIPDGVFEFDENGLITEASMRGVVNAFEHTLADPRFEPHLMTVLSNSDYQDSIENSVEHDISGLALKTDLKNQNNIVHVEKRVIGYQNKIDGLDAEIASNWEKSVEIQNNLDDLDDVPPQHREAVREQLKNEKNTIERGIYESIREKQETHQDQLGYVEFYNERFESGGSSVRIDENLQVTRDDEPVVLRSEEEIKERSEGDVNCPTTQPFAAIYYHEKGLNIANHINWDKPIYGPPEQVNTDVMPKELATPVQDFYWSTTPVNYSNEVTVENQSDVDKIVENADKIVAEETQNTLNSQGAIINELEERTPEGVTVAGIVTDVLGGNTDTIQNLNVITDTQREKILKRIEEIEKSTVKETAVESEEETNEKVLKTR